MLAIFKRKILDEMLRWKSPPVSEKKAFVIKGLRRIGKRFTAKQYAESLYENVIYINFKEDANMKSVFEEDPKVDRMIMDIFARMPNVRFIPNRTIIIFDETQECNNARASIKLSVPYYMTFLLEEGA